MTKMAAGKRYDETSLKMIAVVPEHFPSFLPSFGHHLVSGFQTERSLPPGSTESKF